MSRLKIGIVKDENFQVGHHRIKMLKVGGAEFTLEVQGALNQRYEIGSIPTEVLPGVMISASRSEKFIPNGREYAVVRAVVVIDAPPEVVIHRFKGPDRFAA